MVTMLYALIIIPIIGYAVAFSYETFLAFARIRSGVYTRGAAFVHASWEVTHTLLVYSFTVFMITHAALLSTVAADLFLPISVFLVALATRGVFYLYLYYGTGKTRLSSLWHTLYALAHLASLLAVGVGVYRVAHTLSVTSFTPSTSTIGEVAIGFVVVAVVSVVPMIAVYRRETPTSPL